jgi:hypothetical protein
MKKWFLICAVLFFCCAGAMFGGDEIGEVIYIEGGIDVSRDGNLLDEYIDFGFFVENYDYMKSDAEGYVEIAIEPSTGIDGTIRVMPKSVFYFEISSLRQEQSGSIELLTGSVACRIKKLSGSSGFEVRTQDAIMGVRGTEFTVDSSSDGSILVACSSGEVECSGTDGNSVFAVPGTVVEKSAGEMFRAIPVAVSDFDTFRKEWHAEKIEVLKTGAHQFIDDYVIRYSRLKESFDVAYADLMAERDTLLKWAEEDGSGAIGSKMELMREKKKIIGPLMDLKKSLYILERVYFRLLELEEYHEQGYGRGTLSKGYTTRDFFRDFNKDTAVFERRMDNVRYAMKLYAIRNEGSLPMGGIAGEMLDESFDDDDFFSSDEDIF